jgi:hypothetical protein
MTTRFRTPLETRLATEYAEVIKQEKVLARQKDEVLKAMALDCARHYIRIFGLDVPCEPSDKTEKTEE